MQSIPHRKTISLVLEKLGLSHEGVISIIASMGILSLSTGLTLGHLWSEQSSMRATIMSALCVACMAVIQLIICRHAKQTHRFRPRKAKSAAKPSQPKRDSNNAVAELTTVSSVPTAALYAFGGDETKVETPYSPEFNDNAVGPASEPIRFGSNAQATLNFVGSITELYANAGD